MFRGADATLQPDGKIVIAGSTSPGGKLFLLRFDHTGAPDPTFGTGGRVELSVGAHQVHRASAPPG